MTTYLLAAAAVVVVAVAVAMVARPEAVARAMMKHLPPSRLRVERVKVPLAGLERPVRVVQLSDLHFADSMGEGDRAVLAKAARAANEADADLVVITGDILDREPSASVLRDVALFAASLKARWHVLASLGNHDMRNASSADGISRALASAGARLLRNESLEVTGASLAVVGLGDLAGGGTDFKPARAFAGLSPDTPRLVLSHQPRSFERLLGTQGQRVDLVLAGHTHGGQLALPRTWRQAIEPLLSRLRGTEPPPLGPDPSLRPVAVLRLMREWLPRAAIPAGLARLLQFGRGWRYAQGLYGRKGAAMYVSRGLAHSGARLWCDCEVTVLDLVPAPP